jgi:hypothetical protein
MMCSPKVAYFIPRFLFRVTWPLIWRQVWRSGARSGGGEATETGEVDARRTNAWRITVKVVFN